MIDHHAKLCRTLRRVGVGLALLGGLPLISQAAYTQLTPPPGWVAGTGAAATYQPAAASAWVNSKAIADAAIASASGTSKVRVSLAIDRAVASRVLADRVGTALLAGAGGPLGVGLTVGAMLVLPEAIEWWQQTEFEWTGSRWVKTKTAVKDRWRPRFGNGFYDTPEEVCGNLAVRYADPSSYDCVGIDGVVYERAIRVEGQEVKEKVPADYEKEVKPALQEVPLPEKLPNVVWPASWPVKDPVVNPDTSGKPQPLFVPTGNPVKNPKFDPSQPVSATNQPYLQPGIRVVPAPAPGKPWQVDVQPVDRPVDSPEPKPEPKPDPEPSDGDQPREDDRDLCERNPDILACAKPELDTPDGEIPKKTVDVSYQPENLFGGGACPADKTMTAHGVQLKVWDWQQGCGYITSYVRPVILVLCACVAMAIIAGGAKS